MFLKYLWRVIKSRGMLFVIAYLAAISVAVWYLSEYRVIFYYVLGGSMLLLALLLTAEIISLYNKRHSIGLDVLQFIESQTVVTPEQLWARMHEFDPALDGGLLKDAVVVLVRQGKIKKRKVLGGIEYSRNIDKMVEDAIS
jgi:hypothetical protein